MVASAGLEALEKVSVLKVPPEPHIPKRRLARPTCLSCGQISQRPRGETAREGVGASGADFAVVAPQVDSGSPSQSLEAVVRREG